jgi:hypothetical protein
MVFVAIQVQQKRAGQSRHELTQMKGHRSGVL